MDTSSVRRLRAVLCLALMVSAPPLLAKPACPPGMKATADAKSCTAQAASAASPGGSFDVLGNVMDSSKKEINAKQVLDQSKEKVLTGEATKKFRDGYWEYFQASSSAKPGEYCTALFAREDFAVAILGPGGDYRGALMMFMPLVGHEDFPRSEQARVIKVTLKQASDPPATVSAFNFHVGAWDSPAIAFAVPTIEAAMSGMDDVLDFHLEHDGKPIGSITWHSGTQARESLKTCLASR